MLALQKIGVKLRLMAAGGDIHAGALGLDDGEGTVGIVVEDIVGVAHAGAVGHSGQLHLVEPVLTLRPACVLKHGVDVEFSGFVFADLQGLGHIGLLLLGPAGGQLLPEGGIFCQQLLKLHIIALCPFPAVIARSRRRRGNPFPCGNLRRIKLRLGVAVGVAVGHEIQKNVQIFQAHHCGGFGDLPVVVGGGVALFADQIHAPPDVGADDGAELLPVHEALEVVLIGHVQLGVHRVHPLHRKLHSPPAVQNTRRRVDVQDLLRRNGHLGKGSERGVGDEKCEVGHRYHSLSPEWITTINLFIVFFSIISSSLKSIFVIIIVINQDANNICWC